MDRTLVAPSTRKPAKPEHLLKVRNVPTQLTTLIGREQEVATVCTLLRRPEVRLLTLTGAGGIGKTRLALQIATDLLDDFADELRFVSLATISDPNLVVPTIAQACGLTEATDQLLFEQLKAYLQHKHQLLLLDNFEHLVTTAPLLTELLAACPQLKLLVTSRAVLRVRGEHEFPVSPLALPDLTHLPELTSLSQYPAVALFIQRAQAVKPNFQLTNANAHAIAEVCTHLDGLPLAIELAAARIKLLSPQALLAWSGPRLQVLTNGARDVPLRQQTLRNTIRWSYDLLDTEEQRLFRRLAVFVGGCTLQAAEAIGTALGDLTLHTLDGVASLIDKSLLQQTQPETEEPRFAMLETIREYALECLTMSGEIELIRRAHAEYFLALAQQAEPQLDGPQQLVWLERLEREHENLRTTLHWLAEQTEEESTETALALAGMLWRFWWIRGHWSEGRNFLVSALTKSKVAATPLRAKALNAAGILACSQGDMAMAEVFCGESLALSRKLGDTRGSAASLYKLGQIAWMQNNLQAAWSLAEEAQALFRQVDDTQGIADALMILSAVCMHQGKYTQSFALTEESMTLFQEAGNIVRMLYPLVTLASLSLLQNELATAQTLAERCLVLSREVGDKWAIGRSLNVQAFVAFVQGDSATSRTQAEEAVAIFTSMDAREGMALSLFALGLATFAQADYTTARTHFEEGLRLALTLNHKEHISVLPVGLAAAAVAQGQPHWAVQLLSATDHFRTAIGMTLPPILSILQEQIVAAARAQLSDETFATAWSQGHTMTVGASLVSAPIAAQSTPSLGTSLAHTLPVEPLTPPPTYPAGLTAREVDVLRLVAMGLTNIEVAEKLIISPRTVSTHLSSIFNKLVVSTRSAATRFAVQHHLV